MSSVQCYDVIACSYKLGDPKEYVHITGMDVDITQKLELSKKTEHRDNTVPECQIQGFALVRLRKFMGLTCKYEK